MSNKSIARASVGRSIPSAPLRILDAPDLVDDYYLNLISWGHNNVSKQRDLHICCVSLTCSVENRAAWCHLHSHERPPL